MFVSFSEEGAFQDADSFDLSRLDVIDFSGGCSFFVELRIARFHIKTYQSRRVDAGPSMGFGDRSTSAATYLGRVGYRHRLKAWEMAKWPRCSNSPN